VNLYFHTYDTEGQILQSTMCTNQASFLDAAIDSTGNVYATGQFGGSGQFGNIKLSGSTSGSMFLAKYSPTGVALWAVGSTGGAGVTGWAVALDSAGNAYVAGEFMGSSTLQVRVGTIPLNNYTVGTMDAFVAKIDANGKVLWANRFGDGGVRRCMAITADKQGNAYAGANSTIAGGAVQTVYKFNASGSLVWSRSSKPANGALIAYASATAIAVDDQENVCVTGAISGTNVFGTTTLWTKPGLTFGSDYDLEVTKYDSAGNVVWACKDGGTNIEGSAEICMDGAGNTFVLGSINKVTNIGSTTLTNTGSSAVSWYIAKCSSDGFAWAIPAAHFPGQNETPRGPMTAAPDGSVYFAGTYSGGSSSSLLSKLSLVEHPTITTQPTNQTIKVNFKATLIVEATPARTLSYQWYQGAPGDIKNPVPVQSAISNVFTTPSLAQTTTFWVRVSNPAGYADSLAATITIPGPPEITSQPQPTTAARGQSATLSVTARGTEPLGYQWYQVVNGTTYLPLAGANASTYTTAPLTNTSVFAVMVTNVAGSVYSATADVRVIDPPTIVRQPQSLTITNGQIVTLSVTVTGGYDALVFLWFEGSAGDTNHPVAGFLNTFTTPPLTATTRYWVWVRNLVGEVKSDTAVLALPDSRSTLGTVSLLNGKLNFRLTGAAGSRWELQTSSDLKTWAPNATLGPISLDASGATNIEAQPDANRSTFYRAILLR
jgi:hypothetical protein